MRRRQDVPRADAARWCGTETADNSSFGFILGLIGPDMFQFTNGEVEASGACFGGSGWTPAPIVRPWEVPMSRPAPTAIPASLTPKFVSLPYTRHIINLYRDVSMVQGKKSDTTNDFFSQSLYLS